MAVTAYWYAAAFLAAFNEEIDYLTDLITVSLHTAGGYVPNQDTHNYQDDLTDELSTANGYTAIGASGTSGKALGTKTHGNTNNVNKFDHADPQWTATSTGISAQIMVTSCAGPGALTTNSLLWWMNFGTLETASGGGTFTVAMDAAGAATITVTDATGYPA